MASNKGRKALAPAKISGDQLDGDKLAARHGELVAMNEHQSAIVDQFGDGLPWHPDHYEAAIRSELRRGADAFLRAGSYLVVARECAGHGEWAGMLQRIGLEPRSAQRMMEAARRVQALPNASAPTHLLAAAKNQTKLVELLSLPEEQFTELATTGETGDLTLDDVERMTFRELRAAVREARADLSAKDERIAKLSADVEKEHEKLTKAQRKWKTATPDERQTTLEQRVVQAKLDILAQVGSQKAGLAAAFIDLAEHCNENDLDSSAFMGDVLGELLNAVREVRDGYEYGFAIPVVNDAGA